MCVCVCVAMVGQELTGEARRRGRRRGQRRAATMGMETGGDRDGGGDGGGDMGVDWGQRRRGIGERSIVRDEKLNFFEVFSYIEPTFSTGWSHQPILKVCFGQAKRREPQPL